MIVFKVVDPRGGNCGSTGAVGSYLGERGQWEGCNRGAGFLSRSRGTATRHSVFVYSASGTRSDNVKVEVGIHIISL